MIHGLLSLITDKNPLFQVSQNILFAIANTFLPKVIKFILSVCLSFCWTLIMIIVESSVCFAEVVPYFHWLNKNNWQLVLRWARPSWPLSPEARHTNWNKCSIMPILPQIAIRGSISGPERIHTEINIRCKCCPNQWIVANGCCRGAQGCLEGNKELWIALDFTMRCI